MKTMKITGGLDVGNGYVKGLLRGNGVVDEIDLPSTVTMVVGDAKVRTPDAGAVNFCEDIDRLVNALDVSFVSDLIDSPYRHLFGTSALVAQGAEKQFDVNGNLSKAEQPLSSVLVIGLFAAKALRDYVVKNGAVPAEGAVIDVEARVALALPINEYMDHRVAYAQRFKTGVHTVLVRNFDTTVEVKIKFIDVQVLAEGASAQYGINQKGIPVLQVMLDEVRATGADLDDITADDLLGATNTVGIDIGEGTVNFPVYTNGKFNPNASITLTKGYGNVLEGAIDAMNSSKDAKLGFDNRKMLAEFMQDVPRLKRRVAAVAQFYIDEQAAFFADEVCDAFGKLMMNVGVVTEVVYVYGGGASALKSVLYPKLLAKAAEINSADAYPVLYLGSEHSRKLNREGLFIAAEKIEALQNKK